MRVALLGLLAACGMVASPDDGDGDLIFIPGAQFRPGAMPAPTGGPATVSLLPGHQMVVIGYDREPVSAALDHDAVSAIIGVTGAGQPRGTWILPAGPPSIEEPDNASLNFTYGLDPAFPPGMFELDVAAVDAAGRIGAVTSTPVLALPDEPPSGDLVVGLDWPSTADLDLHVVDPTGAEVWVGNPNTYTNPPGQPPDPCAWLSGGILDHDANANCERDSSPNEHAIWKPGMCEGMTILPIIPSGTYTVRVEAKSLCNDASAAWLVSVISEGTAIGAARGIATPDDAEYGKHGPGAGVTALTFTIP